MYKIFADGVLIYDDTSSDPYLKVASPHLTLEDNAAGSLKMTIPPGNAGYETIERMKTDISVTKDGEEIWFGRVLQEEKDFWNQRVLTCEGALAFLNDTTQPQVLFENNTRSCISIFISRLLNGVENSLDPDNPNCYGYNHFATESRKIFPGAVSGFTQVEGLEAEINSEKTIECLSKFLVGQFGGHLRVRRDTSAQSQTYGKLLLDYLEDLLDTTSQSVEFGKNLMDFTSSFDSSELFTVLVPLGKKLEPEEGDTESEGPNEYLTLDGYTRPSGEHYSGPEPDEPFNGTRYVVDQTSETYGWIENVVHFDDISTKAALYDAAKNYLYERRNEQMQLDLSAFDLHYLNPDIEDIFILDNIYVTSVPHGIINRSFPVTKMDVPLDQPQNTMFQLGDTVKTSLTVETNRKNEEILHLIETSVDTDAILDAARDNATALMNLKTNGYVTIVNDAYGTSALYVSETRWPEADDPDYLTHIPNRYWKWSMTGLGYTDDKGASWKTAITMDGSILGERIAAGSIHGSKITAGTLSIVTSQGQSGLELSVGARAVPSGFFEYGDIDDLYGTNTNSTTHGRTSLKLYLKSGEKIVVNGFNYEVFRYTDNTTPESGFSQYCAGPEGGFSVSTTGYYRLSLWKSGEPIPTISDSDLLEMDDSVDIYGGTSGVIKAEDLQVIGMVTFNSIGTYGGTTIIDGQNIKTGTVLADRLNVYGLTVYRKNNGVIDTTHPTFSINSDTGSVYIDAQVDLSESSVIRFQDASQMTLGAIKDAQKIANGEYSGGTFIKNDEIYSPKIFADTFTATASSEVGSSADTAGSFVLKRTVQNSETTVDAFKIYYWNNTGWEAHFAAENYIVFDPHVRFLWNVEFDGVTRNNTKNNVLFYCESLHYEGGNIRMTGGQIILYDQDNSSNHGKNSFGTWNNRPQNPVRGQLYFRTD